MRRSRVRPAMPRSRPGSRFRSPALPWPTRLPGALFLIVVFLGVGLAVHAVTSAAPSVVVQANPSSGSPVGATITWTAKAPGVKNPVYQFSVAAANGPFAIVRDFDRAPSFTWTPMREGSYRIRGVVKAGFAAAGGDTGVTTFAVTSRVTGKNAVVGATANPLVALYSAPACASGTLTVQFRPASGSAAWQSTTAQPCKAGQSVNVLVAGMRAGTAYVLRHVVNKGAPSTPLPFTTGKPPKGLQIATFTVRQAPTAQADAHSPFLFHMLNPQPAPTLANPMATDLSGNLVWYYDTMRSGLSEIWPTSILPGGTFRSMGAMPPALPVTTCSAKWIRPGTPSARRRLTRSTPNLPCAARGQSIHSTMMPSACRTATPRYSASLSGRLPAMTWKVMWSLSWIPTCR